MYFKKPASLVTAASFWRVTGDPKPACRFCFQFGSSNPSTSETTSETLRRTMTLKNGHVTNMHFLSPADLILSGVNLCGLI